MTIEGMRMILLTRPFKSFVLYLPGDKGLVVNHPDAMLVDPRNRIAILTTGDDKTIYVDLFLVGMIEVLEDSL